MFGGGSESDGDGGSPVGDKKKRSFKKRSLEPEWEVEVDLSTLGNRTQVPDQGQGKS